MNDVNYISRSLEKAVMQVTNEYPAVPVTGPRQVGKTAMLQKLMQGTYRGSMPAAVSRHSTDRQIFYSSYLSMSVERDMRGAGAIVCMKPALGAIDRNNYIVPVWLI